MKCAWITLAPCMALGSLYYGAVYLLMKHTGEGWLICSRPVIYSGIAGLLSTFIGLIAYSQISNIETQRYCDIHFQKHEGNYFMSNENSELAFLQQQAKT